MRALFVDLASHSGLLACVTQNAVVASRSVDHRIDDHELPPLFQELLAEAGWQHKDLANIACVIGPGGFMSLRVAVAFANTLIHQLKIPGAGIHLSDLYRVRCASPSMLWLHSTKRAELFVRGFGEYAARWPEPEHVMLADFLQEVPHGALWSGELLPEHRDALGKCALQEAVPKELTNILPAFLHELSYGTSILLPWYGRQP